MTRGRTANARAHDLPHAWQAPPAAAPRAPKKRRSIAATFLIVSAIFFVIAGGIAAYLLLSGSNAVSTARVSITTQGPTAVSAGDTVPLSIVIENRNPVALENADLNITFPTGTRSADDVAQAYPRYEEHIDSIPSGGRIERSVKAVLFGQEGQKISIPIELSYRTAGSNAVFVKPASYDLAIASSPLTLTVSALTEAVSGQPLTLSVTLRNNAKAEIANTLMQASYPFGFAVANTDPASKDGLFSFGTLAPGASKQVKISGTLSGEDGGTRVFRFTAGTADATGSLSVPYASQQASVTLAAPFLAVTVSINGKDADGVVVSPGATVHATVSWKNALATAVNDAAVRVVLSGAVMPRSVIADRGFYQSSDQSITFDRDTDPSLGTLSPGATGVGSFTFTVPKDAGGAGGSSIGMTVSVKGNRTDQSGVPDAISASVQKTVKVAGALAIDTTTQYSSGPFTNSGPLPPAAGQATMYTVQWNASAGSAIGGAKVTATLPSYVTYSGKTSPASAGLTYTESTRTLTWNIGDMQSGSSPTVSFQVSILPSSSQIGTSPSLMSAPVVSGYDRFAQTALTTTGRAPTTEPTGDSGYRRGSGQVQ